MRLQDKTAFITGGASGIGAVCAELFAGEGAAVAVVDINGEAAAQGADTLCRGGGKAVHGAVDVTSESAIRERFSQVEDELGPVDILINSAGITGRHVPEGTPWLQAWQTVMDINLKGTVIASAVFCEKARERGSGGAVVNLSSIFGQVARPELLNSGQPDPYTHSKGAVVQVTRDLAVGNAVHGIRVNCLCPGFIRTPLTIGLREQPDIEQALVARHPMRRLGDPVEVAKAALFLVSDDASFITGAALPVDGGYLAV